MPLYFLDFGFLNEEGLVLKLDTADELFNSSKTTFSGNVDIGFDSDSVWLDVYGEPKKGDKIVLDVKENNITTGFLSYTWNGTDGWTVKYTNPNTIVNFKGDLLKGIPLPGPMAQVEKPNIRD